MKACVIIPTFNESRTIAGLVREIRGLGLDVLVIDDGSDDPSALLAQKGGATVLRNDANQGKGVSLNRGFRYALKKGFDAVITMDGDGQHLPSDIPQFVQLAASSDTGIFIGNRMQKLDCMPRLRRLTNKLMSWFISKIVRQDIPDSQCGFRLLKKSLLEKLELTSRKYETESEVLIKASRLGCRIISIPIQTVYSGEKSQINPVVDTLRFFRFIVKELLLSRPKR